MEHLQNIQLTVPYVDPNPLIRDHTYSMKIDTNFANDSSGYLYVWRDGVQIVNYHGPIGYGDATYWKEGIYSAVDGNQTIAVDYSNLKITTPTNSYILTGTTVAPSPDPVPDPIENHLPLITSNGGGATASVSVAENTTAVTKVVATNSDTGQTLAYSIVPVASGGGADASKFVIDATTGALAFKTAPNFEAPTDALAAANVYDVTVQVSDNKGGIDKQAIAVTVTDQPETPPPPPPPPPPENHLPLITSNGGGATASVSVAENTTAVTKVVATDSDTGQTLAYSIVPVASGGGADASKFVIDATTGALAFNTAPNFEAPTDALAAANVYDVTVQVSDNKGGIAKQAIAVTVTDQPETPPPPPPPPPPENHLPLITSNGGGATASVSVAENTTAVTKVVATRFGYRTDAGLLDRAGRIRRWRRCIQVRHRCHDGRARL